MDLDSLQALERRELVIRMALEGEIPGHVGPDAADLIKKASPSLNHTRLYVWEPSAIEACTEFWKHPPNLKQFARDFLLPNGAPKIRLQFIEDSFHFFPADGWILPDSIPAEMRNPALEALYPPTTDCIAVTACVLQEALVLNMLYSARYIHPGRVGDPQNPATRERILNQLKSTPIRDHRHLPFMTNNLTAGALVIDEGHVIGDWDLFRWLVLLYQMRIFLEQPFVGFKLKRVKKGHSRKAGGRKNEEIPVVYLRKPMQLKKYTVPKVSQVTGKPLDHEVQVSSHYRHLPAGNITRVRSYYRGPKGVRKDQEPLRKVNK